MKIGRSGYQNIDLSAFDGKATTIPGIFAKASSNLPLKINNLIDVGDFITYGIESGNVIGIPVIIPNETSFVISSLTVTSDDIVSTTE